MELEKEWFSNWFDSPYYHVLYKNRDMQEAEFFLRNLVTRLTLNTNQKLIDLACGKGRHSIFLNSLGFDVTGVDLSSNSIASAKNFENNKLTFEVQDLRNLKYDSQYDVALNLFTSFGYFDCNKTNQTVIEQIHKILKPQGILVIDFMNVDLVLKHLKPKEIITREGIQFTISKQIEDGVIIKQIEIEDGGKKLKFHEEVQILNRMDFEKLLTSGGFTLQADYGNYNLEPFDTITSERLILVATKNA